MPRVTLSRGGYFSAAAKELLVIELYKELMGEGGRPPKAVIFETATKDLENVNVFVVWERWRGLHPSDRTSIIQHAYKKVADQLADNLQVADSHKPIRSPIVPTPDLPLGLTPDEVDADSFPFLVRTDVASTGLDAELVKMVMRDVGAIETPSGLVLRYPARELAEWAAESCVRGPNAIGRSSRSATRVMNEDVLGP